MSGYGNGNGHGSGRNRGDRFEINFTALFWAGIVAMLFAVATGQAAMPNVRDGVVDPQHQDGEGGGEPSDPAPAAPMCSADATAAFIVASGLSVAAWQAQQGIVDDGIIGPQTQTAAAAAGGC